jgi:hypothetical protein
MKGSVNKAPTIGIGIVLALLLFGAYSCAAERAAGAPASTFATCASGGMKADQARLAKAYGPLPLTLSLHQFRFIVQAAPGHQ